MQISPRRVVFPQGYYVRFRAALNHGDGRLMTLSEGGAYVATVVNLLPQAQLSMAIDIPELDRTVEVEAVVAWENRGATRRSSQPDGYGLRFIRVPAPSAEAIQWLLRQEPEQRTPLAEASPRYPLDIDFMATSVPPSAAGIFVVGRDQGIAARIGRADSDLKKSLAELVGRYGFFHFELVATRKERFERECELYHQLGGPHGGLDNEEHPIPSPGSELMCPVCTQGN
ncbi:MAG TPA: PilZ domain-containing protein [Vicinamibacteria bacterium]|nr:PilZ domain-containing protein [Vicinamibacteria bacterium]